MRKPGGGKLRSRRLAVKRTPGGPRRRGADPHQLASTERRRFTGSPSRDHRNFADSPSSSQRTSPFSVAAPNDLFGMLGKRLKTRLRSVMSRIENAVSNLPFCQRTAPLMMADPDGTYGILKDAKDRPGCNRRDTRRFEGGKTHAIEPCQTAHVPTHKWPLLLWNTDLHRVQWQTLLGLPLIDITNCDSADPARSPASMPVGACANAIARPDADQGGARTNCQAEGDQNGQMP